MPQASPCA